MEHQTLESLRHKVAANANGTSGGYIIALVAGGATLMVLGCLALATVLCCRGESGRRGSRAARARKVQYALTSYEDEDEEGGEDEDEEDDDEEHVEHEEEDPRPRRACGGGRSSQTAPGKKPPARAAPGKKGTKRPKKGRPTSDVEVAPPPAVPPIGDRWFEELAAVLPATAEASAPAIEPPRIEPIEPPPIEPIEAPIDPLPPPGPSVLARV